MFEYQKRSYDVLKMDGVLDNHFISNLESKWEDLSWKRVDAESADKLIDKDLKKELQKQQKIFQQLEEQIAKLNETCKHKRREFSIKNTAQSRIIT